jgi:serine/threonine protein kinase
VQSEAASTSDPAPIAGRYSIIGRIGAGGAGVVYRVRDEVSGRLVAFKQLLTAKAGKRKRTMEALFEREYHTLVRLKHPRIIEVYDYGVAPDGPYYTMELLEGSDLGQLPRLPHGDVCRHLRDVASSLALLHAQRLVHRDVSPRNIRLTSDGSSPSTTCKPPTTTRRPCCWLSGASVGRHTSSCCRPFARVKTRAPWKRSGSCARARSG